METTPAAISKAASTPDKRIIAIGGAKGGIGKSLIAANLGVWLASRGRRTVLVDMDLGGANLHLYLGVWSLKYRINDYLDKKVDRFDEIAVPTAYGPRLIGGGSSRLGSANIAFARKLKLMRAIRALDADDIIIDLGGDTAYNILDFYLLADYGIVMTSCDPAAYLDAYNFIKMALYRRLTRLFGPESAYRKFKDEQLQAVIREFVNNGHPSNGKRIDDLMALIDAQAPDRQYLVRQAVAQFSPYVAVNMSESREETSALVDRIAKVSRRMLSVDLKHLASIPTDQSVARSAHDLKPEVARHPTGALAGCLARMHASLN